MSRTWPWYALGFAALAALCAASVWPPMEAHTVPAFQQDWAWPLSRPLALQWFASFAGLWDERGLGQANPLPWQTYFVTLQCAGIALFGAAGGVAACVAALELGAACACWWMLRAFGVRSPWAAWVACAFYGLGPVVFTRVAAGHLAYLAAYALLPVALVFAQRTIEKPRWLPAVALGIVVGLCGSQIQFLAIAWLAVVPLAMALDRARGWPLRLLGAAGVAFAVQLQALLPLALSSTPSLYFGQRALLSFEYNNSAQLNDAAVALGYFTRYYETHAPAGYAFALAAILVAGLLVALAKAPRWGAFALVLVAFGTVFTAGLYGPVSWPIRLAFEHSAYATVFRDLHYFAALTELGTAIAAAFAMDRVRWLVPVLAIAVAWSIVPTVRGDDVAGLLVPRALVADAIDDMNAVHAIGPGRVLWLPAREPLGLRGAANAGRDFTAYGPPGNPSLSDDFQNPQLAYALASLRDGRPDWDAFAAMNVRYLVYRRYVRTTADDENFGTGFRLAYERLHPEAVAALLRGAARLRLVHQTPYSSVYELRGARGASFLARAAPGAMLYPELSRNGTIAVLPHDAVALGVAPSDATADPRIAWVAGRFGWRYDAWLPQSIYPFVWTVSRRPLAFAVPAGARCALAGARGGWRRVPLVPGQSFAFAGDGAGPAALATLACPGGSAGAAPPDVLAVPSGYDAGWRAVDGARLVPPAYLANGWMMAWDARDAGLARVYLPAFAQLAGLLLALAIAGWALVAARRRDERLRA